MTRSGDDVAIIHERSPLPRAKIRVLMTDFSMADDAAPQAVLDLTCALIARKSLTPDDADCCTLIGERLSALGFELEWIAAGGVTNLWATLGSGAPLTILAGHTDVVPPGPRADWLSDPFVQEIRDGVLYGRGAADMKSGLAAMVVAVDRLLASGKPPGTTGTASCRVRGCQKCRTRASPIHYKQKNIKS